MTVFLLSGFSVAFAIMLLLWGPAVGFGARANPGASAPFSSVLSDNLEVLTVTGLDRSSGPSGGVRYSRWSPSAQELKQASALRPNMGKRPKPIPTPQPAPKPQEQQQHRTDYIDLGRNFTPADVDSLRIMATGLNVVVELVIVCDKEFSALFGHNRQAVLNYLTIYLWDLNNRYRTLPSNSISFRLNGLVLIADTAAQPFIEAARGADGRAEFNRILDRYSYWVYQQKGSWPAFDLAPLITHTSLEWHGGLAYMNAACWIHDGAKRHLGTAVWNDDGSWNSLTVAAHELAHNLGAPHDHDPKYPGGCTERQHIMGGASDELRWYFSSCSDRTIGNFVRSSAASCLQRLQGAPIIDPAYANPAAPDMDTQCKMNAGPTAFLENGDKGNCAYMRCLVPVPGGGTSWWVHHIWAVDNTICTPSGGGTGRCFRGNCRLAGSLLQNIGTGLCMRDSNPREFMAPLEMFACPSGMGNSSATATATPLDRFVVRSIKPSIGRTLESPYYVGGGRESGDACAWTGRAEGDAIWTDRCGDHSNAWHGWEFRNVGSGSGEFLLVHKVTGRCAKPKAAVVGAAIGTYRACNSGDAGYRWKQWA